MYLLNILSKLAKIYYTDRQIVFSGSLVDAIEFGENYFTLYCTVAELYNESKMYGFYWATLRNT